MDKRTTAKFFNQLCQGRGRQKIFFTHILPTIAHLHHLLINPVQIVCSLISTSDDETMGSRPTSSSSGPFGSTDFLDQVSIIMVWNLLNIIPALNRQYFVRSEVGLVGTCT